MVVKNEGPVFRMRVPANALARHADRDLPASTDERRVRKACALHAWNRVEPSSKIGIETRDLGIDVTGLAGVQIEQQDVLAVETELNGLQVRQRAHEEAGGDEQKQRNRDLRDHEQLAQARPPKPIARAALPAADANFLEGRHDVRSSRLNGRRQTEQHAAHERQHERHDQNVPVQFRSEREVLLSVGQQQRQDAHAEDGNDDAK